MKENQIWFLVKGQIPAKRSLISLKYSAFENIFK
jgi:hypothetical protein